MSVKSSSALAAKTRLSAKNAVNAPAEASYKIQIGLFKNLSPGPTVRFLNDMLTMIQHDNQFREMQPTRMEFEAAKQALSEAFGRSSVTNNRQYTAETKAQRLTCHAMLVELSEWISEMFPENPVSAEIAGFTLYKTDRNRITPAPPQVQNTRIVQNTVPGEITLACDPFVLTGKIQYIPEVSTDDGKPWMQLAGTSNSRKIVVTGLKPAVKYLLRVFARTTGGDGKPSSPNLSWIGQ